MGISCIMRSKSIYVVLHRDAYQLKVFRTCAVLLLIDLFFCCVHIDFIIGIQLPYHGPNTIE